MQLFERPRKGERAILVHIEFFASRRPEAPQELRELVVSAGAEPVAAIAGKRQTPDPRHFVGAGKAEEIRQCVTDHGAEVVVFDHALTPAQERNLEKRLQCRVLDRTGLILDIFAQRAQSFEGKLQVELAQLRHLSTRLVRGWTHLERQKGGIGLRGPGETQLETDRRLLGNRIKQIDKRLEKVSKQRDGRRQARRNSALPTVSLVGYTNAGKSTLFNRLTDSGVYEADQLFATLDTTLRRVDLPRAEPIILADTVGFIRDLPHNLVAAFRATLEETKEASLLLHVIDAHSDERKACIEQVNGVLKEIGADSVPQLEVYNKVDLLDRGEPRLDRDESGRASRVWLSAATGEGLELLYQALAEHSHLQRVDRRGAMPVVPETGLTTRQWVRIAPEAGRLRSSLFDRGVVVQEQATESGGWLLEVELLPEEFPQLAEEDGCEVEYSAGVAVV